jgi:copper chaperone
MKTLKFKTNIKCGGCIAAVTPFLNKVQGIENWEVDTVNPDKILTVNADNLSAEEVLTAIKAAGYTAESISA